MRPSSNVTRLFPQRKNFRELKRWAQQSRSLFAFVDSFPLPCLLDLLATQKSRQNVRIGKAYLGLKLISTELLGALADLHLSEGGSCRQGQHQQKRKREREDGDDTYGSIPLVVLLGDIDKQNSSDVDHLHYASEEVSFLKHTHTHTHIYIILLFDKFILILSLSTARILRTTKKPTRRATPPTLYFILTSLRIWKSYWYDTTFFWWW